MELLREQAALGTLQYAVHFQGGAIGSGLMVLSRHPILEVGPAACLSALLLEMWQRAGKPPLASQPKAGLRHCLCCRLVSTPIPHVETPFGC